MQRGPKQNVQGAHNKAPRIPLSLQVVFLNGNRGVVVNAPPPEKVASNVFRRWWHRRSNSNCSEKTVQSFDESIKDNVPVEEVNKNVSKKKKV